MSNYGAYTGHSTYRPEINWEKCEGLDLNIFHLKRMLLTKKNLEKSNLGSRFESTIAKANLDLILHMGWIGWV